MASNQCTTNTNRHLHTIGCRPDTIGLTIHTISVYKNVLIHQPAPPIDDIDNSNVEKVHPSP